MCPWPLATQVSLLGWGLWIGPLPRQDSFLPWGPVQLFSPLAAGWGLRPHRGQMAGNVQECLQALLCPAPTCFSLPAGSPRGFPGTRLIAHLGLCLPSLLPRCPARPAALSASVAGLGCLAVCLTGWFSLSSRLWPPGLPAAYSPAPSRYLSRSTQCCLSFQQVPGARGTSLLESPSPAITLRGHLL